MVCRACNVDVFVRARLICKNTLRCITKVLNYKLPLERSESLSTAVSANVLCPARCL